MRITKKLHGRDIHITDEDGQTLAIFYMGDAYGVFLLGLGGFPKVSVYDADLGKVIIGTLGEMLD